MQDNAANVTKPRGNQAYILAATDIYDSWVRNNYDLQVWQEYLKLGTQNKHWAKDVIKRTKTQDERYESRKPSYTTT